MKPVKKKILWAEKDDVHAMLCFAINHDPAAKNAPADFLKRNIIEPIKGGSMLKFVHDGKVVAMLSFKVSSFGNLNPTIKILYFCAHKDYRQELIKDRKHILEWFLLFVFGGMLQSKITFDRYYYNKAGKLIKNSNDRFIKTTKMVYAIRKKMDTKNES